MTAPAPSFRGRPAFSGGPCPTCGDRGALLVLRRPSDGMLLFHCPACGLAFTHVPAGTEPEYGRSLESVAPGAVSATEEEIRRAGLARYALPRKEPPRSPEPPREKPRRAPLPAPSPAEPEPEKKPGCLGGFFGVLLLIKILALLLKSCGN